MSCLCTSTLLKFSCSEQQKCDALPSVCIDDCRKTFEICIEDSDACDETFAQYCWNTCIQYAACECDYVCKLFWNAQSLLEKPKCGTSTIWACPEKCGGACHDRLLYVEPANCLPLPAFPPIPQVPIASPPPPNARSPLPSPSLPIELPPSQSASQSALEANKTCEHNFKPWSERFAFYFAGISFAVISVTLHLTCIKQIEGQMNAEDISMTGFEL